MSKHRDEIVDTLSDTQKELLMKYDDAVNAMYAEFEKEAFVCGFKLGCRIISETLDTKTELTANIEIHNYTVKSVVVYFLPFKANYMKFFKKSLSRLPEK